MLFPLFCRQRHSASARSRRILVEQLEYRLPLAILPPSGLVSWYRSEASANDSAGSNNGTLENGVAFAAGEVGQAFNFDGADDDVNIPDSASLAAITTAITVDAWINPQPTSTSSFGTIFARRDPTVSEGFSVFVTNSGALQVFLRTANSSGGVSRFTTADGVIQFGQFQHVATSYASNTVKAYVNGQEVAMEAVDGPISGSLVNVSHLFLGQREATSTSDAQSAGHFHGMIDELSIYNRGLSQSEIQSIYSAGSDGKATIVVDTAADVINANDGLTSLREAITQSNATVGDRDVIGFNIANAGVHTISIALGLPIITDPVIIDGYTQPGAMPNTNAINDADPTKRGLNGTLLIQLSEDPNSTASISGLAITANTTTVRGLVINGFKNDGIQIGGNNNVVAGNYIGTDQSGSFAVPNKARGILVYGAAQGNLIGTDGDGKSDRNERNLISGNGTTGILISGTAANGNSIAGNFIGTNAAGTASIANGMNGVQLFSVAQSNRVGIDANDADAAAERNLISGNGTNGVVFNGASVSGSVSGNTVAGNLIGTDATGALPLGNGAVGVRLVGGAQSNVVGGSGLLANTIAFNKAAGVAIADAATINNAITQNSIYSNTNLGIDLGQDGATANDLTPTQDADTGANNLQNFPVISYATRDAGKLKAKYTVPSDPANSTYPFRVEFFLADASGQGRTYLGFDTFLPTDFTAGSKTVTFATAAPIKVFDKIVATATDSLTAAAGGGPANTSEFSPSVTIVSPWQNHSPRLRWDVTDDTFVSADDVLAVINYINAKGSGLLPDNAKNEKPYVDVDGDNNVVAADCLDVINYINAGRQLGGEAEATWDGEAPSDAPNSVGNALRGVPSAGWGGEVEATSKTKAPATWEGEDPAEPLIDHSRVVSAQSSSSFEVTSLLAADIVVQRLRKRK
jgi:hypothetical protein